MANIDLEYLAFRESKDVLDWYHPDWFRRDDKGMLFFIPPAFAFRNGRLFGVNGRHRAVLLFRHRQVIPMLLVRPYTWPKDKLDEIAQREIGKREMVELPDLPINDHIDKSAQELEKLNR